MTLKAIPLKGFEFRGWEGVTRVSQTSDTITFTPAEDMNIKAIYQPISNKYTLSGYISADIDGTASSTAALKEGFTVEISEGAYTAKTDSNGYFKIDNIPAGINTNIQIKKPGYLQREIRYVLIDTDLQAGTSDKPVLLWPGDMKTNKPQDNAINLIDIMELAKHFNSLNGEPRYSSQCDFNNDSTVNMTDILIAAKNFNKATNDYPAVTLDKVYND